MATVKHRKLYHKTPGWVPAGSRFHIRIRVLDGVDIATKVYAPKLLESVQYYHNHAKCYAWILSVMPDHIHGIISFPRHASMSRVIGDWKKYHAVHSRISWQENYFDHRLRNEDEFREKMHYIRMNPIEEGLCAKPEDWPWVIEPW